MYVVKTSVKESPIHGKGYFAEEDIPMGTIVYFYADEDKKFSKEDYQKLNYEQQKELAEFAVENEFGGWVLTKSGPYTNHSCNANILPIFVEGLYCDVAVRDIKVGEEITIDYGLFFSSQEWQMECGCKSKNCRKIVGFGHSLNIENESYWQQKITRAVNAIKSVEQPIFNLKDKDAEMISHNLKNNLDPKIAHYLKFSLIRSQ